MTLDALRDLLSSTFRCAGFTAEPGIRHSRNAAEISAYGRGTDGLATCVLTALPLFQLDELGFRSDGAASRVADPNVTLPRTKN